MPPQRFGSNGYARNDVSGILDAIRSIAHCLRVSPGEFERKSGVSAAQLEVLRQVKKRPAFSVYELALRTHTRQSSVSTIVARLAEKGFVRRAAARSDARRISISLTSAGRAVLRKSRDMSQARLVGALETLSRADRKSTRLNSSHLVISYAV